MTNYRASSETGTTTGAILAPINDFRLTLTSGTPVTTSDVTSASIIYLTPTGRGNRIALYDGSSAWTVLNSSEVTFALGTLTSGKNYDLFAYNNSGSVTLEALAWTNDTTRATALTTQNGVYVKTGDTTRRYLGTFRTTSTTTTEDSAAKRFLFNAYNRARRNLLRYDSTGTWNYTTGAWRQANASTANQVAMVVGLDEDIISTAVQVGWTANTNGNGLYVSFGLDSTTAVAASAQSGQVSYTNTGAGPINNVIGHFRGNVGVGYHYLAWLEYAYCPSGTGTVWSGSLALNQNIVGEIIC